MYFQTHRYLLTSYLCRQNGCLKKFVSSKVTDDLKFPSKCTESALPIPNITRPSYLLSLFSHKKFIFDEICTNCLRMIRMDRRSSGRPQFQNYTNL